MKHRVLLVLIGALGWSMPWGAAWGSDGWSGWGRVLGIMVAGPYLMIDHESPAPVPNQTIPCGKYDPNGVAYPGYIIDTRTLDGQNMHSLALSALIAQRPVRFWSVDKQTYDPHCLARHLRIQ